MSIEETAYFLHDYARTLPEDEREEFLNRLSSVRSGDADQKENPAGAGRKTYSDCVFLKKEEPTGDYGVSESFEKMLDNPEFYGILKELTEFGIKRFETNYSRRYQDTNLVLYQKYTYEDVCRLLDWEYNEVPLNIGGYKYDNKTHLSMECFLCGIRSGVPDLKEHEAAKWLTRETLGSVGWLPADLDLIEKLEGYLE